MKKMIVSVNDMGMSKEINKKIIEAYKAGVLTHAAVLSTGPALDDALKKIKANPGLEVSAHLDLSWGKPVLESYHLTDEEGQFLWSSGMNHNKIFTDVQYKEVDMELRAQLNKLLDMGFKIVALSSHAGFTRNTNLFRILIKICNDYKLIIRDELGTFRNASAELRYGSVLSCDGLYGHEISLENFDNTVKSLFRKSDIIDIPFIPGYTSKDSMELDGVNEYEEIEPVAFRFSNLKKYLATHSIKLTNYKKQ